MNFFIDWTKLLLMRNSRDDTQMISVKDEFTFIKILGEKKRDYNHVPNSFESAEKYQLRTHLHQKMSHVTYIQENRFELADEVTVVLKYTSRQRNVHGHRK